MPRRIVYGVSLWVFLGAVACTIAAILLPDWVSYTAPTNNDPIRVSYGLTQRCSTVTGKCTEFPQNDDCTGHKNRYFCSMWRSSGFLMDLSLILEVVVLGAYLIILFGGRGARDAGWKVLSGLLGIVAAAQLIAMALVAYLYDHDSRFFPGWILDKSWVLCTVSWSVLFLNSVGVILASAFMPREDDYEPIPESR